MILDTREKDFFIDAMIEKIIDDISSSYENTDSIIRDIQTLDINNNPSRLNDIINHISTTMIDNYISVRKASFDYTTNRNNPLYTYDYHSHKKFVDALTSIGVHNEIIDTIDNIIIENIVDCITNLNTKDVWKYITIVELVAKIDTRDSDYIPSKEYQERQKWRRWELDSGIFERPPYDAENLIGKFTYSGTIDKDSIDKILEHLSNKPKYNLSSRNIYEIILFIDVMKQICDNKYFKDIVNTLYSYIPSIFDVDDSLTAFSEIYKYTDIQPSFTDKYKKSIIKELQKGNTSLIISKIHKLKKIGLKINMDKKTIHKVGLRILDQCSITTIKEFWEYFEVMPMSSKCFAGAVVNSRQYSSNREIIEVVRKIMDNTIEYDEASSEIFRLMGDDLY